MIIILMVQPKRNDCTRGHTQNWVGELGAAGEGHPAGRCPQLLGDRMELPDTCGSFWS